MINVGALGTHFITFAAKQTGFEFNVSQGCPEIPRAKSIYIKGGPGPSAQKKHGRQTPQLTRLRAVPTDRLHRAVLDFLVGSYLHKKAHLNLLTLLEH